VHSMVGTNFWQDALHIVTNRLVSSRLKVGVVQDIKSGAGRVIRS
jgi:hypothetical protein